MLIERFRACYVDPSAQWGHIKWGQRGGLEEREKQSFTDMLQERIRGGASVARSRAGGRAAEEAGAQGALDRGVCARAFERA